MLKQKDKNKARQKRHQRVRNKVNGTASCPRLNVYRSLKHMQAQVIDDVAGTTLVSASTLEKDSREQLASMKKADAARAVGKVIGERAVAQGITQVVFDRGGYLYTGRVQALAEGAREAGLQF